MGLPNIHSISSSHTNLLRAISSNASAPNWFSVIESTGWLGHVADLLKAAGGRHGVVGRIVDDGASVLVVSVFGMINGWTYYCLNFLNNVGSYFYSIALMDGTGNIT